MSLKNIINMRSEILANAIRPTITDILSYHDNMKNIYKYSSVNKTPTAYMPIGNKKNIYNRNRGGI